MEGECKVRERLKKEDLGFSENCALRSNSAIDQNTNTILGEDEIKWKPNRNERGKQPKNVKLRAENGKKTNESGGRKKQKKGVV